MSDFVTVFRKELIESTLDPHSFAGIAMQSLVIVLAAGVLLPVVRPTAFAEPATAMGVFFVFSSVMAAALAADAFAGERERKTLETLLATPLSDGALLYGKAACVVCQVMFVAALALSCAMVTSVLRSARWPVSGATFWGVMGAALAAALLTASLSIAVSARSPTVRAARHTTMLISFAFCAAGAWLFRGRTTPLRPAQLLSLDAVLILAGFGALALVALLFRRCRVLGGR